MKLLWAWCWPAGWPGSRRRPRRSAPACGEPFTTPREPCCPRAEVEIRNVETGATRMVAADEAGRWREPILYSENFHERDAAIRISGGDVQSAEPSEFFRSERADRIHGRGCGQESNHRAELGGHFDYRDDVASDPVRAEVYFLAIVGRTPGPRPTPPSACSGFG